MLSNKDKEWIKQIIKEEFERQLTVPIKMEKRRDIKSGKPLAVPDMEIKNVHLPAFLFEYIPFLEGAIRGVQEQMCIVGNSLNPRIEAVANILIQFENSLKCLATLSDKIKQIETQNINLIEDNNESDN